MAICEVDFSGTGKWLNSGIYVGYEKTGRNSSLLDYLTIGNLLKESKGYRGEEEIFTKEYEGLNAQGSGLVVYDEDNVYLTTPIYREKENDFVFVELLKDNDKVTHIEHLVKNPIKWNARNEVIDYEEVYVVEEGEANVKILIVSSEGKIIKYCEKAYGEIYEIHGFIVGEKEESDDIYSFAGELQLENVEHFNIAANIETYSGVGGSKKGDNAIVIFDILDADEKVFMVYDGGELVELEPKFKDLAYVIDSIGVKRKSKGTR